MDDIETRRSDKNKPYAPNERQRNQPTAKEESKMTNTELMNKVMTDDELNIVAGGHPMMKRQRRKRLIKTVVKIVIKGIDTLIKKYPKPTETAA